MTQPYTQQTFFLPRIFKQYPSTIRSDCFNLAHTLLNRAKSPHVFVPIRSMQYLAVIDGNEVWFIDSLAYAVEHNEGGRLITISWRISNHTERQSLDQNIPMDIIFYARDQQEIQLRLTGEFYQAMSQMDQRYRDEQIPSEGARIIKLNRE